MAIEGRAKKYMYQCSLNKNLVNIREGAFSPFSPNSRFNPPSVTKSIYKGVMLCVRNTSTIAPNT